MDNKIRVGEYIVIQRQNYTKLHKFSELNSTVMLGKESVELSAIEGQDFFKTFKMQLKEGGTKRKRVFYLEPCDNAVDLKEILKTIDSGSDNRNIKDDGQSQSLSNEEILNMRENISDSKEIVSTLVANSKSFNEKTEFSQEKYIRKKEKKYFEFVQIRRPTIRLLSEIFYRQDTDKALGLRMDSLSQLISYSGVNSSGNYLIYESGTSGLVPAALLNSMGDTGSARLVHIHPGNFAQKQAMLALNLNDEQYKKCVSVNIYSVLRQFYQSSEYSESSVTVIETTTEIDDSSRKRKLEDDGSNEINPPKKLHIEGIDETSETPSNESTPAAKQKRPKWWHENREAIEVLKQKVDSLVIVAREDPFNIVKELLQFVHPGRPVVIFHTCKEVLMECYFRLKTLDKMINLRLTTNWMRNYQVLPMRTHPAVQIQGTSGFLLVGYTVGSSCCT